MTDYIYTLLWFKKKGGSVLKAVETKYITGMSLMQSKRKLAYVPTEFKVKLSHDVSGIDSIEVLEQGGPDFDAQVPSVGTANLINLATGASNLTYFSFSIQTKLDMTDDDESSGGGKDKDIILRTKSIDSLLEWMNIIAQVYS